MNQDDVESFSPVLDRGEKTSVHRYRAKAFLYFRSPDSRLLVYTSPILRVISHFVHHSRKTPAAVHFSVMANIVRWRITMPVRDTHRKKWFCCSYFIYNSCITSKWLVISKRWLLFNNVRNNQTFPYYNHPYRSLKYGVVCETNF